MEIGADIIKTNYCGDVEEFTQVIRAVPVPIIVAGGPKVEGDDSVANMVRDVVAAGASGVAIGRRVWQSDDPQAVTKQIYQALWED
jgi:DhnA family fructose-bisphosphate aldolase class Ia